MNETHQSPLHGLRILIVEDVYIVADAIADMVHSFGCEPVGPFSNVHDAMLALEHEHVAGALLDINLGEETSYDLADHLLFNQIPFIFMSGYGPEHIRPDFRGLSALTKPFNRQQLQQMMLKVFAHQPATNT